MRNYRRGLHLLEWDSFEPVVHLYMELTLI